MTEVDANHIFEQLKNINRCIIDTFSHRKLLHEKFCTSQNEENAIGFIREVIDCIALLHKQEKNMCTMSSKFFLRLLPDFLPTFKKMFSETQDICMNSLVILMQNYGHIIFTAYSSKHCEQRKLCGTVVENSRPFENETVKAEIHRAVIAFGGGCLGLLWRINKKRALGQSGNLSLGQLNTSKKLYKMCLQMRETDISLIPESLRIRNRGGMFFPDNNLLPFLHGFENSMRKLLTENNFRSNGNQIIKVVMKSLNGDVSLKTKFLHGCQHVNALVNAGHTEEELLQFYRAWLSKLAHSRFEEAWSARVKLAATGLSKGGQSLRDKMYTFASEGCKKKKQNSKRGTVCAPHKVISIATTSNEQENVPSKQQKQHTNNQPKPRRMLVYNDVDETTNVCLDEEQGNAVHKNLDRVLKEQNHIAVRPKRIIKKRKDNDYIYE